MEKTYNPSAIETKWYDSWEKENLFASDTDKPGDPFCIVIPPPNVTGTLHMGHAFQDTIMDILTRYHRMLGRPTLWQPGMDHAGIATQMVVERQLNAQNLTRQEIGREAFVDKVWEWKDQSGGAISNQLKRLGASADWARERFTMDDGLSDCVIDVFVKLYQEGLIYRGKRLVNWDPKLHTALSDLEVLSEEENGHLWHFKYPITDNPDEHLVVATTRPETMLGDTAVAVHPDDIRYKHLVGKTVTLPLCDREIPVVADDYVDPEFGSGCVKITPAHDFNDYEIGLRHDLEMINIFDISANINGNAPEKYRGMARFEARKAVVKDLDELGLLDKIENHTLKVPRGDRSGDIVEPYLTEQWYVKILPLAEPAIEAVEKGDIKFVPENWSKTYFEWMRNIQDWCISRQLWWGHRIPAWYDEDGNCYVGRDEAEVREHYKLDDDLSLRQDDDVLDTWFSSALWPFTTLGWPETTAELKTFYPTSVLVTGFDIIFFWVARMIMMGIKFADDIPFHEVYIHGLVRDGEGQKMSKSKGNILDPLDLIDGISLEDLLAKRTQGLMQPHLKPKIEKATKKQFPDGITAFGTDALRFTFAALATNGRDIRFDLGRIDGYHKFCNKLWQASRYVISKLDRDIDKPDPEQLALPERWILGKAGETIQTVQEQFKQYRFDLASQALYEFTWHEFCDWYLEISKPALTDPNKSQAERDAVIYTLKQVLDGLLKLLHPIMPFITEEIWQTLHKAPANQWLMTQPFADLADFPKDGAADEEIQWIKDFVLGIRQIRGEMDISPGKPLDVLIQNANSGQTDRISRHTSLLTALGRLKSIRLLGSEDSPPAAATALLGDMNILVPMADLIDPDAEIERLTRQMERVEKDRSKALNKLNNPKFVENAPASIVEQEKTRVQEFEKTLSKLVEQIDMNRKLKSEQ